MTLIPTGIKWVLLIRHIWSLICFLSFFLAMSLNIILSSYIILIFTCIYHTLFMDIFLLMIPIWKKIVFSLPLANLNDLRFFFFSDATSNYFKSLTTFLFFFFLASSSWLALSKTKVDPCVLPKFAYACLFWLFQGCRVFSINENISAAVCNLETKFQNNHIP